MKISASTKLVGLIGHPIGHSMSPIIHNALYKRIGLDLIYLAFDIRPENLNNAMIGIKALDLKGFNVTIPHKEAMIGLVDSLDPYAKKLGAINTVKVKDGQLIGYNTDGQGFIKSLKRKNISVKDKSIVIIGAGGAARSIAVYIGLEGPKEIRIVNRTYDRGKVLANLVNDLTGSYIASPASHIPDKSDIIVNTTSLGMWPNIKENPISVLSLSPQTIVCDIVYNPRMTAMLRQAERTGCQIVDGTGMLIGQALASVGIWTGKEVKDEYWQIMQEELDKL